MLVEEKCVLLLVSVLLMKSKHMRFVSNSKPARGCGFTRRDKNISLPSTAIAAGMVHNIHRISIIGHFKGPDIQIKYVQIAIDSESREGTGGPSPPIERSQIAQKTNSNLNQVWAKPKKTQTEGRTEQHEDRGAHNNATISQEGSDISRRQTLGELSAVGALKCFN